MGSYSNVAIDMEALDRDELKVLVEIAHLTREPISQGWTDVFNLPRHYRSDLWFLVAMGHVEVNDLRYVRLSESGLTLAREHSRTYYHEEIEAS